MLRPSWKIIGCCDTKILCNSNLLDSVITDGKEDSHCSLWVMVRCVHLEVWKVICYLCAHCNKQLRFCWSMHMAISFGALLITLMITALDIILLTNSCQINSASECIWGLNHLFVTSVCAVYQHTESSRWHNCCSLLYTFYRCWSYVIS